MIEKSEVPNCVGFELPQPTSTNKNDNNSAKNLIFFIFEISFII